jgi:hypothetical protein
MSYAMVAAGIATVVAAGASYYNNQQVANRQDQNAAAALRQQGQLDQQTQAKTNQLIQKDAQSSPDAAKASLLGQFMQVMQQNKGHTNAPLAQVGNVSGAYTKAANDAALGVSQYGNTNANLLSSIDAPGVQRQAEAANLSDYGGAVNELKRQSAADDFLMQMRARDIRPNPWISAVGDMASAYARTGGAGFGGGSVTPDSGGAFNGATGAGTYTGTGSTSTSWPGMNSKWGT